MDELPFVAPVYKRDLQTGHYFIGYLKHPYVSLYTGRGCRSKCTFCLWPQTVGGHRYRVQSAENVLAEILWIKQSMPEVKEIMFDDDTQAHRLQRELEQANRQLETTYEELQSTNEELETTNEELQSTNEELETTNEELQSANEELQSGNEELETGREEMQSLNEELATVNAELRAKVDDLGDAQSDLQNLLNSTDTATIFLDADLNIKVFTPAVRAVASLIVSDLGRPLSDIASKLEGPALMDDAREVLRSLVSREREIRSAEGTWYLMRALPYRTVTNSIGGVILTFSDITAIKQAEAQIGQIQTDIDRCLVRAPVDGVVLQVSVRPGEFVGAPPSQALLVLGATDKVVHVRVDIDEHDIPRFKKGVPAEASLRGRPDVKYPLKYVRTDPYVIPKKSLTGDNTERVDTRVLQVLYVLDVEDRPICVGQQMDVFSNLDGTPTAGEN